jgi:uncharacterized membrane protein YkoI
MTKPLKTLLMTTVMVGTLALTSQSAMAGMFDSDDFSAEQLATVKVNITEAIAKAKEKQSGTVISAELEKEDGKLAYEIKFLDDGKEMEVMIDAVSGNASHGKD